MSEFKTVNSNYFILFSYFSFSFILFLFFGDLGLGISMMLWLHCHKLSHDDWHIITCHIGKTYKILEEWCHIACITHVDCYNQYLMDATWTRVKGNDDIISCTTIVSISTSCSRYYILALSSCVMTYLPYV